MHLECNRGAICVCKQPRKFFYPYLGINVERCCGIECTSSMKMAIFERYHVGDLAANIPTISPQIQKRVSHVIHPHISYVVFNSRANTSSRVLINKFCVSPL